MSLVIKNVTLVEVDWGGVLIEASGQYDLQHGDANRFLTDDTFLQALDDNEALINNGSSDLSILEAKSGLANLISVKQEDVLVSHSVRTIDILGNATVIDDSNGKTSIIIGGGVSLFGTVMGLHFSKASNTKDTFLYFAANHIQSHKSSYVMPTDGLIVAITYSKKKKEGDNSIIQVIKNSKDGGSGIWKSGIQIGSNLETNVNDLYEVFSGLTGFTFSTGDRIGVYIKKGTQGDGEVDMPVVTLWVKFN